MSKEKQTAEQAEARKYLKKYLRPGSTVYCVLRSVSGSGMSRRIDFYAMRKNRPQWLSGYIGCLLGYSRSDKQGLLVRGCGMDMGFSVVYSLGSALYPKGFKIPKGGHGRNGDTSGYDPDGGYALQASWL